VIELSLSAFFSTSDLRERKCPSLCKNMELSRFCRNGKCGPI